MNKYINEQREKKEKMARSQKGKCKGDPLRHTRRRFHIK